MKSFKSFKTIVIGTLFTLSTSFSMGSTLFQEVELDGGDRIICSCTWNSNCRASGSSGVCAQSEAGGNIQCSGYNSNC